MKTISPLMFDFNNVEVTFEMGGKKVTLTGVWSPENANKLQERG